MMKKLKRFVVDHVLERVLSKRSLESWLAFWAYLVVKVRRPLVISVTGSVGKSTTTAAIAHALTHQATSKYVGLVAATVGNMNDDVGVPATLLRLGYGFELPYNYLARLLLVLKIPLLALRTAISNYPKIMVLECGADGLARFAEAISIAPPEIAIVTTIGAAHLENLKSLDGVADEKGALVRAVSPSGLVILGDGHQYVDKLESMARAPVIRVSGRGVELAKEISYVVCQRLGIQEKDSKLALSDFKSPEGRLTRIDLPGMTVIDDTYNANPVSVKLGIDTLMMASTPGHRRLAILGPMAELGEESEKYHKEIGIYARERVDILIGVGNLSRYYQSDYWFEASDACAMNIVSLVKEGDFILVKGSASAKMSRVVAKLSETTSNNQSH
jgi:UDP-N-acetylmuramoyl-tripeptide--D-alanyl-D-alanine ligase